MTNTLPADWSVTTLGECADWYSGGTPPTEVAEYWHGDIPWITASSLHDFYVEDSERRVTQLGVENGTRLMPKDTILFVVRGMSLKTEFRVGIARRPVTFGQDCKAITPHEGIEPLFLANVLRAKKVEILGMVDEASHGTGRLQTELIQRLEVPLPPLSTQRRIADILSALDDKIELNRQINATLEAMAQAIFKEWFVDFNYPGATGEMVDSELGLIPAGWRVGKLGEVITNYDSKRIPLSSREREKRKGKYPYYGAASIVDYIDDYLFDGTFLLMGEDGTVITDDEKPVLQYVTGKFWVNNHAHVLQGQGMFSTEFAYLLLSSTNIKHIVTGAVQPKINQKNMNNLPAIIPVLEVLSAFQMIVKPIYEYLLEMGQQSQNLIQIRDTLLPKLMRGEIEV